MNKNLKIKDTLYKTRAKRTSQKCMVFKFKINSAKLSKQQKTQLKMMFVEGKWFYNHIISKLSDKAFKLSEFNPLIKTVEHFDKDGNSVTTEFNYLTGSCKQTIAAQIMSSLKTINTLVKRKFQTHGNMRFISDLKALNFKQYGVTHKILSSTTMKLQGVSKPIKVSGLQQLKKYSNLDFANAKLLNTPAGYYIALTCYIDNVNVKSVQWTKDEMIGLDFGCQTHITDSNGNKLVTSFEEPERLKILQRKLAKKKDKSSNRRNKLIKKIRKQYQHIKNKKRDFANKFVHELSTYKKIVIQDEQLANWHKSGHGKAVQHACLGLIKAKLKQQPNVVVLDKFIPTTKLCSRCGHLHSTLTLKDRVFTCPVCNNCDDRDVHSAKNMTWIFENLVGRDATEFTLKEFKTAVDNFDFSVKLPASQNDDLRRCQVFSLA